MNRSQRCGQCRGCTAKPCGRCIYCQDSPQFGGPGVKKQSCIERRCLKVLENRLQRDGPSLKAKIGCGACDECLTPDCHACLICLDKKFFENRYLPAAMCAKKRCNQARSLELTFAHPHAHLHPQMQQGIQTPPGAHHLHPPHHFDPYSHMPPRHVLEGLYGPVFHHPHQAATSQPLLHHIPLQPPPPKRASPPDASEQENGPSRKKLHSEQSPGLLMTGFPSVQQVPQPYPLHGHSVSPSLVPDFGAAYPTLHPTLHPSLHPAGLDLGNGFHHLGGYGGLEGAVIHTSTTVTPSSLYSTGPLHQPSAISSSTCSNESLDSSLLPLPTSPDVHAPHPTSLHLHTPTKDTHHQQSSADPKGVTHLSPSYWQPYGLAATDLDSFSVDPSTLIPPSLSGSPQVVLQPL